MKNIFLIFTFTAFSSTLFAHGYLTNSRSKLCADNVNSNCGPVIYEPQSVEGPDGFPSTGPEDGTIAAAGSALWTALNEQSPSRWHKNTISSGVATFQWKFTANHVTADWRYYITKENWNSSVPLTRDAFVLEPFCLIQGNNQQPDFDTFHQCTVPERSGYQVILGVWDVGDTSNSFYSTVDVQFSTGGGGTGSIFSDIGDINPTVDLDIGDKVRLRLFTTAGEQLDKAIELTIETSEQGMKNSWPRALAELINVHSTDVIAGIPNGNNEIIPADGRNDVFARQNSQIIRTEIGIERGVANTMPITLDDSVSTNFQTAVTINVLANDSDPDGSLNVSTVTIQSALLNGQANLLADGRVNYVPNNGFSGIEAFEYKVSDNAGSASNNATVTITVNAKPVTPVDSGGGSSSLLFLLLMSSLLLYRKK